jgi:hypothetical protein
MNELYRKLHEVYSPQRYDHTDVWAGDLGVTIGDTAYPETLARCYSDDVDSAIVQLDVYVRDIVWAEADGVALMARVWSDANDLGRLDERGVYHRGSGGYIPMSIHRDDEGRPALAGNNLKLRSEPIALNTPGVFHYSVSLSADGLPRRIRPSDGSS